MLAIYNPEGMMQNKTAAAITLQMQQQRREE